MDIVYTGPGDFYFTEEIGARSPGWYEVECLDCETGWYTTGTESVVQEAAREHYSERHAS